MIPASTKPGLLPPGIHWASGWAEVEQRYGINSHRQRLLAGMLRGLQLLQVAGCREAYLDGSFTTEKELPKDFDICWETEGVNFAILDPVFEDMSNLRAAQKLRFFGEFLPVTVKKPKGHPYRETFELFQRDKQTRDPKGIVALRLGT